MSLLKQVFVDVSLPYITFLMVGLQPRFQILITEFHVAEKNYPPDYSLQSYKPTFPQTSVQGVLNHQYTLSFILSCMLSTHIHALLLKHLFMCLLLFACCVCVYLCCVFLLASLFETCFSALFGDNSSKPTWVSVFFYISFYILYLCFYFMVSIETNKL